MIDHDAIAAKVRQSLKHRHASGYSEDVQRAYLDLYDEVKRLRDRVLELNRETLKGNEE